MATLVLGTVGSAIGGHFLGAAGAAIGYTAMASIGGMIQQPKLPTRHSHGVRLSDLHIQSSSYGKVISEIYGTCRVAGNIIWSLPIKEDENVIRQNVRVGKGRKRNVSEHREYSYYATFAIALCKGEIQSIDRVWADCDEISLTSIEKYRLYRGGEEQMPDSLMEAVMGARCVPAYRGLAYIVIEDFPITTYGNRIPNFTFEVTSKSRGCEEDNIEDQITSIVTIPGAGEFVYDIVIQYKCIGQYYDGQFIQTEKKCAINRNNAVGIADAVLSLKQLKETCKNIEWIAPVASWFATNLNIGTCNILPGVEYQDTNTITEPDLWRVENFRRNNAHAISYHKDNYPNYGGTPNDASIVRYLQEARRQGYKILFYPMLFCDVDRKPWRGRMSGHASQVSNFFNKENGYNAFILHYAHLVKGKVDGFVIGSELIGITSIRDRLYNFPAVDELVKLAIQVKQILGDDVVVTYAADWTEYHHDSVSKYYHLDPLWSCSAIDVIGIDAYFPLTNNLEEKYEIDDVIEGWKSGEGYDFYYSDQECHKKVKILQQYAWKNIEWWWNNYHMNPNGKYTNWVPKAKKIWFTEYGFPSVDCATNQPNIFVDNSSSEGGFPRYSNARVDFMAQKTGILGTERAWQGSDMVENKFLWCWDARPYPFWPAYNNIWRDAPAWKTGHWINGKTSMIGLASVIQDLCLQVGMELYEIDVHALRGINITGVVINEKRTAREIIELLSKVYFFRAYDIDGILTFIPHGDSYNNKLHHISHDELVVLSEHQDLIKVIKRLEDDLPTRTEVNYLDAARQYQLGHVYQEYNCGKDNSSIQSILLPVVLNNDQAYDVAKQLLYESRISDTEYKFYLSSKYMKLNIGEIICLHMYDKTHVVCLTSINYLSSYILEMRAISCDLQSKSQYYDCSINKKYAASYGRIIRHEIIEIPIMDGMDPKVYIAVCPEEENWKGCNFYNLEQEDQVINIDHPSVMGNVLNQIAVSNQDMIIDCSEDSNIEVVLMSGALESIERDKVLLGYNLAMVGNEIIQFCYAKSDKKNHYILSGIIRGCLGTEREMHHHCIGERFVLLDRSLTEVNMKGYILSYYGDLLYKIISVGDDIDGAPEYSYSYRAEAFKPYAPFDVEVICLENSMMDIQWSSRLNYGEDENEVSQEYKVVIRYGDVSHEAVVVGNRLRYMLENDDGYSVSVARMSRRVGEGYYAHWYSTQVNL